MRLAVLSDIHGNLPALDAVLSDAYDRGITSFICLGDVVINGPFPGEVLDRMRDLELLAWIQGNTDSWLVDASSSLDECEYERYCYALSRLNERHISLLRSLPVISTIHVCGIRVLCVHGSPRSPVDRITTDTKERELIGMLGNTDFDLLLCGHTHLPIVRRVGTSIVFNPGSVGYPLKTREASYGIAELVTGKEVTIFHKTVLYDVETTKQIASERGFPNSKEYQEHLEWYE